MQAWMTAAAWQVYLTHLVNILDIKDEDGKRVILIADNAPSHFKGDPPPPGIIFLPLPKNMTGVIQPNDQGIIAAYKRRIRKLYVICVLCVRPPISFHLLPSTFLLQAHGCGLGPLEVLWRE